MNTNDTTTSSANPVRGMNNIYDDVSTSVASAIKQELMDHFGKGLYYRMKNGEKDITAEQQAYIAATFSRHGIDTPRVYDSQL